MNTIKSYIFYKVVTTSGGGGGGGQINSIVAGTNISVDNTDPANPVVSTSGLNLVFQPLDSDLTAISGITYLDGDWLYREGGTFVKKNTVQSKNILFGITRVIAGVQSVNNNAVANTLQDVTGMLFPVVAGTKYYAMFVIPYISANTATGMRFTLTGPAITKLVAKGTWANNLGGTSDYSLHAVNAYDLPTASSTASTSNNSNVGIIELWITPSVSGNVQLRFASEIAGSAVTTSADAWIDYNVDTL